MKKNLSLLWLLLCLNTLQSFSQEEIPVDMYTGTPTIQVPLWTVSHHDISLSVALSYNANGIRAGQPRGNFGLGWTLIASGSVKRELKGLPDDFTGTGTDLRRGWLYTRDGGSGVASEVGAFGNTADLSATTCNDEQADHATLSTWNDLIDTEPDVFSFSFPGYSGSFVFDNAATPAIHLVPYQDIDIRYTTVSASDKKITSFTIRTNDGYKYTFGRTVNVSKSATKGVFINDLSFLTREYNQYKNGAQYFGEWKLTRIDSPTGAYADLSYTFIPEPLSSGRPVVLGMPGRTYTYIGETQFDYGYPHGTIDPYNISEASEQYWLNSISGSSGQEIKFMKNGELLEKVVIEDTRRAPGDVFVKAYTLSYQDAFLTTVAEYSGCERKPPYRFDYIGGVNQLPPDGSASLSDYWGYTRGAAPEFTFSRPYFTLPGDRLPKLYIYPDEPLTERFRLYPIPGYSGTEVVLDGTDRRPSENAMKTGVLNKLTYPSGGSVVIQYEAHRYHDQRANQAQLAGGLRVKTITQFDGVNNAGRVTKEFLYTDPATGQSSGKLISRPQFMMPAWKYRDPNAINDATKDQYYATLQTKTVAERWKYLTIRSEADLSEQAQTHGSSVGYKFVTVKRSGTGSALFEFHVPGTFGETANGFWTATQGKFARPVSCGSMSLVTEGGAWGFPFMANPDIDHERGMVWKKSEYDEDGRLVRFTENDYQYIFKTGTQPYAVWGVQYDRYPNSEDNIYFYGKYFVPTDYARVPAKETVTTYDPADNNKNVTASVEYFYESPNHKLLSRTKTTTADGTEYTSRTKYARDFGTIASNAEPALLCIKSLQDPDVFRHGLPIEQWSTVKFAGGTEKVTGASLILLSDFSKPGKTLLQSTLSLAVTEPVDDFSETPVELVNGTYKLVPDARYETTGTTIDYDDFDKPLAQTGTNRVTRSMLWGFDQTVPVATLINAGKDEFAFSDLETVTTNSFQLANAYFATPRTGRQGLHPYATLSATIVKGSDNNYTLSFWLKNSAAVSFRVTVKSTDLLTTYYDNTFSYTPTGSDFELIRKTIPVSGAPATFVIQLAGQSLAQPSASSSTLLPAIDDIAFLPETADLTSYTYDLPHGVASVTNAVSVSSYVEYDKLGRQTLTYDHNRDIRSRSTYTYATPLFKLDAALSTPLPLLPYGLTEYLKQTAYLGETVTFTAHDNPCIANVTYEWAFDDFNFTAGTTQATHVFNEEGTKTIRLRVSAPGEQPVTASIVINVINKPIAIMVCANGAINYECGQATYLNNTCPSNPAPSQGTVFYASMEESLQGVTYTWKKRFLDDEAWVEVGTNSNQYVISGQSPNARTFEVKCEVSAPDGRTGESNRFRIEVYPCQ